MGTGVKSKIDSWRSSKAAGGNSMDSAPVNPTNATLIENMNESQLSNEISKAEDRIDYLNKQLLRIGIQQSELAENFPLGVGGDGWTAERRRKQAREIESDTRKAANFKKAYDEREQLKKRLESLKNAEDQVKGTGKTQKLLNQEKAQAAVNASPQNMRWKTTQKGGFENGAYAPKIIKSGDFEIRGSSGLYDIYHNGRMIGRTDKLSKAKAFAERRNAR